MNLDGIKQRVKENPRLACIYMCIKSLKSKERCEAFIASQNDPYVVKINRMGELQKHSWMYVICFDKGYEYNGFCSLYRFLLAHLAYAEDLGFIPVVYWGERILYFDPSINEIKNVFEYYFEPVSNINIRNINQCNKVIVSKSYDANVFGTIRGYDIPESEIQFLAKYQAKYISLKPEIKNLFWGKYIEFTGDNNTLGVHVRATDFNKGYNRHPVVVTPEEYLLCAKESIKKYGFSKIFLATDDANVIRLFESEFGEKLCYYEDIYRSKNGEAIHYGKQESIRMQHQFKLGIEIIKDFYTLGACAGLIAGKSNVSVCARILKASYKEKYKYLNIIDKGNNRNMKETRSLFNSMKREVKQKL